jgi:hypothetical protein
MKRLSLLVVALTGSLLIAAAAAAETTHVYPVSLAISVDRAAAKIDGTITTEAPSEFCESSTIRVLAVTPGDDKLVARLTPYGGEFHMKSTPSLRGKRVYAEVLAYHLPSRPVECLAARSRAVTMP